jgi:dipeptide transport system permease protein
MFATFVAIRLVPGDPVETRMGEHGITPERLAMLRHQLGLDLPVWQQFLAYVWQLLHGDFGTSLSTQQKVLTEFLTLFPATLELTFFAFLFALTIGLPMGAIAAVKRGSYFDQALMSVATIGYSMPIFWWGLLLIMFVAVDLGLTPVSGRIDLIQYYFEPVTGFMTIDALLSDQSGAFLDALHHLILPAIVLGTVPLAVIARMTRSSMLEVLGEDYVRTARAKGLSPFRVVALHALRNALLPVVTMVGLQVSSLLAGAVLTETIFSWPGIGKWLIESIGRRDYPALQGGVMLVSLVVIMVNVLVDLLYGAINPRIRHGR